MNATVYKMGKIKRDVGKRERLVATAKIPAGNWDEEVKISTGPRRPGRVKLTRFKVQRVHKEM